MYEIPLIKPYITEEVKREVLAVLDSGQLTEGPVTRRLEEMVGTYVGARHCLAATSCTTGLEMALRALGIGPGDEVIVPVYTYPASASVVRLVGALPVLVDVDPETMLLDWDKAEKAVTTATRAVMPVSLFGSPVDYAAMRSFCSAHRLFSVEDAACSLGASHKGIMSGAAADISVFSLHPRKFITTGEGGLITTDNGQWAAWMDSFKHFGIAKAAVREDTVFERIGTNYKLSNLQAAVGVAQMRHVDELLAERRRLAENYTGMLRRIPEIEMPRTVEGGNHSYQSFCVFVRGRDAVMRRMRERGVEVQIGTYLLSREPAFRNPADCRIAMDMPGGRRAWEECLALPLYHAMTETEQARVIEELSSTTKA